jgi:hypothetical protein
MNAIATKEIIDSLYGNNTMLFSLISILASYFISLIGFLSFLEPCRETLMLARNLRGATIIG